MRRSPFLIMLFLASIFFLPTVYAANTAAKTETAAKADAVIKIGETAPGFTLTDLAGRTQALENYRGRTVVLEWYDPGCQWNQKQYESKLPKIQRSAVEQGVTWFTIVSGKEAIEKAKKDAKIKTVLLLDPENKVAKMYGAKKSLQTFVIDVTGHIVYMGALDAGDPAKPSSIPSDRNYVYDAYRSVMEKTPVNISQTESYGCPITL